MTVQHCTTCYTTVLYSLYNTQNKCAWLYKTVQDWTVCNTVQFTKQYRLQDCTVYKTVQCTRPYSVQDFTVYNTVQYTRLYKTLQCTRLYSLPYCTVVYKTLQSTRLYSLPYCTVYKTVQCTRQCHVGSCDQWLASLGTTVCVDWGHSWNKRTKLIMGSHCSTDTMTM